MTKRHPYDKIDRATRATLAKATGGVSPHSIMETWMDWSLHLSRSPGRQLELFERITSNAMKLLQYSMNLASDKHAEPPFAPRTEDHRFTDEEWKELPYAFYEQAFLSVQDWWQTATDEMPGIAPRDAERAQFQVRQALDLVSPFNFFFTNPEIMRCTIKKSGTNLSEGASLFYQDAMHTFLQDHQEPPQEFEVGTNLACTPGKIIYKNDLFELIQYSPTTKVVKAEPILFVPAWIMKYYVLDLSPKNSMVRYLISQGFTVFMMSWVNPSVEQSELGLDDYRKHGIMTAIDKVNDVMPDAKIHINGYCLGGTLLAITAAEMSRRHDERLASVTLMAAQVDFAEAGELSLFIDDSQVAFIEDLMWTQGYLDRPQMTRTFTTIRS